MQGRGEQLYLVMADPAFRAACFAALVGPPGRVVRGFADPLQFRDAALEGDRSGGIVIFADAPGRVAGLHQLLLTLVDCPDLAPVLISGPLAMPEMLAVIRAGVRDLVPAPATAAAVADRVAQLLPSVIAQQQQRAISRAALNRLAALTPREHDVLALIADGQSAKSAGRSLDLSPRTVEVHRANIMRRLGVASLAELLRLYFQAEAAVGVASPTLIGGGGLIPPGPVQP